MTFPRFGPNGAFAMFSDERDVPPGWQPTAEDARRMQTLAPPVTTMGESAVDHTEALRVTNEVFMRIRKQRR